jgi:hypothetical protein
LNEHDCVTAETLEFVAVYGAPGTGQAWRCVECGQHWSHINDHFQLEEEMDHVMSPQETR